MSFSEEVKTYLSKIVEENRAADEAEFYGFLHGGMSLVMKGRGTLNIKFETDNAAVARKIYKLIKDLFSCGAAVTKVERSSFGKNHVYTVDIEDSAKCKDILHYYNMDIGSGFHTQTVIESGFVPSEEEQRAYLRGLLLSCGYIADPFKSYLAEFHVRGEDYANSLAEFLWALEITAQIREKNSETVVYIKRSEDISTLLALCGAYEHMLQMEDKMAMKDMKNKLQRIVNCETANMNKTIDVALAQIEAINKIIAAKGLASLPDHLVEAAQLRLDNPEGSLNELARSADPPVSRSTLDKRLRKIIQIAGDL